MFKKKEKDKTRPKIELEEKLQLKRSGVRIHVTKLAAWFVFVITSVLVAIALWKDDFTAAKDLFLTVLPVATGIITYWFADRSGKRNQSNQELSSDTQD